MPALNRFANIGFEDFRRLAVDESLSDYERIGFPDSYREGYEASIFVDILSKLTNLSSEGARVLDIGPGCSELPRLLIEQCRQKSHSLLLVDSAEMLNRLPDEPFITKEPARYPDCVDLIEQNQGKVDAIVCYSVIQYVISDASLFGFFDTALSLLAPTGQMLIGDVPNLSKRKRFFASETGIAFHKEFTNTEDAPEVVFNCLESGQIDDAIVFALLQRARTAGFNSYVMPQHSSLPMANRREDILIVRP
ncbi:methyltransferase domain-containing protein [Paraburkholderia saeva]|uniref:methyltransferase domain-containing protein n=1 Tax=Paraburkholderia saeva TaxID=2777537 RepID=UPI001DA6163A|nr:class I SAM-dependent methyltransferase [Paraburkholderia saeva]CAG4906782.1 hypothetical protein R52603_03454 [Paraburkholderia saeva]